MGDGPVVARGKLDVDDERAQIILESLTPRSEEHTSELQSHLNLVCRLLLEKKKKRHTQSVAQLALSDEYILAVLPTPTRVYNRICHVVEMQRNDAVTHRVYHSAAYERGQIH